MASTIEVDKIKHSSGVAFTLPTADGTAGQLLKTDGSQGLGWATDVDTGITSVAADTTPQLGGELDGQGNVISDVVIKDYAITTVAKGNLGATPVFDVSTGNHQTGTVNQTITSSTFTNPTASDEYCGFVLSLTNGAAFSVTWPTSVDWAGGTAPTLTTSGLDILHFFTYDGGTIWHGVVLSTDSK
jgi:hypothetical protein